MPQDKLEVEPVYREDGSVQYKTCDLPEWYILEMKRQAERYPAPEDGLPDWYFERSRRVELRSKLRKEAALKDVRRELKEDIRECLAFVYCFLYNLACRGFR